MPNKTQIYAQMADDIVYPITQGRSVIAGLNSISNRMVSIPQRFDC